VLAVSCWKAIALCTNIFYYHRLSLASVRPQAARWASGWFWCPSLARDRRPDGALRFRQDPRPRHPEAIEAILLNGAKVEPSIAVLKPISAAISIGSGGPFGAEGPIIMTAERSVRWLRNGCT